MLEPTRQNVLDQYDSIKNEKFELDLILPGIAGTTFYTTSAQEPET